MRKELLNKANFAWLFTFCRIFCGFNDFNESWNYWILLFNYFI